jgi:potassium/hydrogen antiporter
MREYPSVSETLTFGAIVLIVAGGFTAAVLMAKLTERFPVPGPALFLLVAAGASDLFPGLTLPTRSVERIGVVALVVILFDGGMHVGLRRFRSAALEISVLGVAGTFATAALVAVAARAFFDFGWTSAGILGAALAPTDPAVLFSVLGKREIAGRTGSILEGESGANDPVGIALMLGMLDFATHPHSSFWVVPREFAVELAVGVAVGIAGAHALLLLLRRVPLPQENLYPIGTLAGAGVIYGATSVAHGSGFVAVFIAGLLVGDERAPRKGEIERFHTTLAGLAEIVVFTTLGLTVEIAQLGEQHAWLDGLVMAIVLAFVVRPLVAWPLLLPTRLSRGERLFVAWGGLKGAVPILLGTLALLEGVADARLIYRIVFVVVAFSVLVQGTTMPLVAHGLGVPMRLREPRNIRRYVVGAGSRADGAVVKHVMIGHGSWIERVARSGVDLPARGSTVMRAGDEVWLIADADDVGRLTSVFGPQP